MAIHESMQSVPVEQSPAVSRVEVPTQALSGEDRLQGQFRSVKSGEASHPGAESLVRRKPWLPYVGVLAVASVAVTGTVVHKHMQDPCQASFELSGQSSSENILETPDGTRFKLYIGNIVGDNLTIGYRTYGAQERPAAFDVMFGDSTMTEVSLTALNPKAPEVTYAATKKTNVLINVTPDTLTTSCAAIPPLQARQP